MATRSDAAKRDAGSLSPTARWTQCQKDSVVALRRALNQIQILEDTELANSAASGSDSDTPVSEAIEELATDCYGLRSYVDQFRSILHEMYDSMATDDDRPLLLNAYESEFSLKEVIYSTLCDTVVSILTRSSSPATPTATASQRDGFAAVWDIQPYVSPIA